MVSEPQILLVLHKKERQMKNLFKKNTMYSNRFDVEKIFIYNFELKILVITVHFTSRNIIFLNKTELF